jgi:hypothetical protein
VNRRIRPDDLHTSPCKDLIHTLARGWADAALPATGLTYEDYTDAIAILLLTTQSPDRTKTIVQTVLEQATTLHKTSDWVHQELKFEGMIEGIDRIDFLRLDLSQNSSVDDAALDLYNERVNRFMDRD